MKTLLSVLAVVLAALGLHSSGSTAQDAASVRSIRIHSAAGVSVTVTKQSDIEKIVSWFDALPRFVPRPCPYAVYEPPKVTFVFHRSGIGRTAAVDRVPGTCAGEIDHRGGKALADDGFVARVSKLLGVSFDPNARTKQNIAAATVDVAQNLGLVRVPAGGRPLAKPTAPRVYRGDAQVDAHRAWKVRLPFADVVAFEKAHPPRGSSLVDTFVESVYPNVLELTFRFRPFSHRIPGRTVEVVVTSLAGGGTRISVVAFDGWHVARSLNEKVPAGVREVVVSGRSRSGRITRLERVARVVRWFDSLPVAPPAPPWRCNVNIDTSYQLPSARIDFLGADGTKLAAASTDWCNGTIAFSAAGHNLAPLGGGFTVRQVERLAR